MSDTIPCKIDTMDIQTAVDELMKMAKPITRRVSYGIYEYPVIDSNPFFNGLKEMGVTGYATAVSGKCGPGIDVVRLETNRYRIDCESSQKDEYGYYSINEFITYVSIRDKSDLKIFKDFSPEGPVVKMNR